MKWSRLFCQIFTRFGRYLVVTSNTFTLGWIKSQFTRRWLIAGGTERIFLERMDAEVSGSGDIGNTPFVAKKI
ncbi:MAG: hypothetical protein U0894_00805 [Pirellulales bacterium]